MIRELSDDARVAMAEAFVYRFGRLPMRRPGEKALYSWISRVVNGRQPASPQILRRLERLKAKADPPPRPGGGPGWRNANVTRSRAAAEETVAQAKLALPTAQGRVYREALAARIAMPRASLAEIAETLNLNKNQYAGRLYRALAAHNQPRERR